MFLVLMALSVGVVLAGVALTSRESGPRIGANAEAGAQAEWSSRAAAAYAESVLRAGEDWIAKADGGVLMDDFPFAGGTVDVTVTDDQGNPPTGDDRELMMTVTATIRGMTITEMRRITRVRPVDVEDVIKPYLDEFAIFAKGGIEIEADAQVRASPIGDESNTLMPIKIGTGFSSNGSMVIDADADLRDTALYVDNTGSAALESESNGSAFSEGYALPFVIPAIPEILPSGFPVPTFLSNLLSTTLATVGLETLLPAGHRASLRVQNNSIAFLGGASATPYKYRIDTMQIGVNGVLRVQGAVMVYVPGTLQFNAGASLELVDANSSIIFYLGDSLTIDNAGIGVGRTIAQNAARDPNDLTAVPRSDRVYFIALSTVSGGAATPNYVIRNNAIAVACIHAPQASVEVRDGATLIGRVTANFLRVRSGSRLWYDPMLDDRVGYTALDGPLYNEDGTPITELTNALAAINPSAGAKAVTTGMTTSIKTATNVTELKDEPTGTDVSVRANGRTESRLLPTNAEEMEAP